MDALKDFAQKDMIEQITLLDEISASQQVEALPALFDLYSRPLPDQAVDEMVYHTLFGLLSGREADIIAGLQHQSGRIRLLCIRQAMESGLPGTMPELMRLLSSEKDPELLSETIRALGAYQAPELVDALLPFLSHPDEPVAAWTMRVLAGSGASRVRDALMDLIRSSDTLQQSGATCDLRTALAVESLGRFPDATAIGFLIDHIHHPCPAFRKEVITTLISMGEAALPGLEACLESGDKDEKIMAANIVGLIGDKKGADLLVAVLHQDNALDANLKFAIYEALGRIPSLRSAVGLNDGLAEENEMVLLAVITGMEQLGNPGVLKTLAETVGQGTAQSGRILKAIITGRAGKLFKALYQSGQGEALLQALLASRDQEAMEVFREVLAGMEGEQAAADAARLAGSAAPSPIGAKRVLAADDSKAILFFYKGVAADLGLELATAKNGREALDLLEAGQEVDLLITDLNMPQMDGVELTKAVRQQEKWANLPILMATTESEHSQADLARQAGVTDFISKPFTAEQFREKLARLFG